MQKKMVNALIMLMVLFGFQTSVQAQDDARLLRFPDINGDLVTFVYAGDIWTVDAEGGNAKRLTSHKGLELFPKISPDGQWIAFSAEYSGSRQVYVMPATGGTPKQLTYYNDVGMMPPRGGFDNVVLDWTPDSKQILFRANRTPYGQRNGKYFLVSVDGGLETPLQIAEGGFGVLSPEGNKMCFAPISREFRTWKRYKGGRAADLWIFNLQTNEAEQITEFAGTDQIPTWFGDKIYFASDRDLRLNIHSYNTQTGETKQLTFHKDFDVMWPSGNNGQIAYENGGYIYKLNVETGEEQKLTVNLNFDNPNILPYYTNVKEDIHSMALSPAGNRALLDARGDIFSVPAEHGEIENLTKTQGVREIYPTWSPNGKYISYMSDKSGEYEIYLLENKEGAEPRQLTSGSARWKYQPVWSHNSKYLLYSDRTMKLKLIEVASGKESIVDAATTDEIRDYTFSPDARWITYTKGSDNSQSAVWVYNIQENEQFQLTGDEFNDMSPTFSTCGNYLFFMSNRDFNLAFSDFEFNYLYNKATRIYAIALRKDSPKLFPLKEDTVPVNGNEEKKGEDKAKEDLHITIDRDGIRNRITALPMSSGSYYGIEAVDGGLLYTNAEGIHKFTLEGEKEEKIIDARSYVLSADGSKLLYSARGTYGIIKLTPKQEVGAGKIALDDLEMKIDPRKEWNQIYQDGWRIFRDYYYVKNMHGVDWKAIGDKYAKLLPYLSHRADLDYILGEIIAETNTGHAYVNYGDFERVKRLPTGLLGAKLALDDKAGRYKIAKIFEGENWNPARRSPLTEQGVDVTEGDYLLAINGHEVKAGDNPYRFLENTVDKVISITVNNKPEMAGAKSYKIKPIDSELELFYLNWVKERRKMAADLSDGKIGYIHVPNTAVEGNRELHRGMYAFHDKEGLIIDDRYNGGGFIPDQMADLLDRETLAYWHQRDLKPFKTPGVAHDGPKAMLINHYSSSGGDAFPYFFRKKGLGTIIGTRTWGGLVGMSGNASLVDGGYIAVPRFGIFNDDSEWIIEGIGIYPDIKVIDAPDKVAKGHDPSLEKAVEVLLKQIEEQPKKQIHTPEPPNRSGWIEVEIE
ncbi:MAG: S41 family peptidase [Bacteroidota bacterium]